MTTFSRLFLSLFLYPSVAKSIYNFGRLLYNSSVYINTDTGKLSFDEAFSFLITAVCRLVVLGCN